MPDLTDLRLDAKTLARYGLPDITYPIPGAALRASTASSGALPLTLMLSGLQQRSRDDTTGWQSLEVAMDRLATLLAPADGRSVITASGDGWWLEVGPVDLDDAVVTVQRDCCLLAAIQPTQDGRLRVAAYRPLDAKSAGYLIALGQVPHPEHGVALRENNWEYALDASAGMGHVYAAERGEAYLSFWEKGIGIRRDGAAVPDWVKEKDRPSRAPRVVATELGVHSAPFAAGDVTPVATAEAPEEPAVPGSCGWPRARQQPDRVRDRFLGCLLGGAVGDALGAPVEFLNRAEICRCFGPQGITTYAPAYGGIGTITDDTQMTLFTAEGLLRAWVRGCFKGITTYPGVTARAYLRWLKTQREQPSRALAGDTDEAGWLFQQRPLHSRRAPGNTCLSALRRMTTFGEAARNDSKGCGGVMRVAPVGLFAWRLGQWQAPREAFRLGVELAALTHGHPTGSLTAGVLAVLVLALTDGAAWSEALAAAKACLRTEPRHDETLRAIELAEALAGSDVPSEDAIARLGQGWVAEEALAIALYCALVARDFRHGVVLAVNHDGDSDSTGAIAGNLLGACLGVKAIPAEWMEPLELRDVIAEVAADLYAFPDWEIGAYSANDELNERIRKKYPGG